MVKQNKVDEDAVRATVEEMPSKFSTRDVADDPRMQEAHRECKDDYYNPAIGTYLSKKKGSLRIQSIGRRGKTELWEKTTADNSPDGERSDSDAGHPIPSSTEASPNPESAPANAADIGPQYSGDSSFKARMRFHQSWFRAAVLRVPCGTGPNKNSTSSYGNMLGRADGERGLNFISAEAFAAAKRRIAEGTGAVEPFRLLQNMLSSMPMCFNLFGNLASEPGIATTALKSLLGENEVKCARDFFFEYAPNPPSEYLNDRTAFDVFIIYERPDGSRGFLGIETKLTEPFSQKFYDGPSYRRWVERIDSPWPKENWEQLNHIAHNQLWRGHLLAIAMLKHPRAPYTAGRFAVLHHPGDVECTRVLEKYRSLLKPQDHTFLEISIDRVIEAWEKALPQSCSDWLAKFSTRYLDIDMSEEQWQLRCR